MTALRKYERVWFYPRDLPQMSKPEVFLAYDFKDALAQSEEANRKFGQEGHRQVWETRPHVPLVDEKEENRKALASLFPDQPEAIARHLQRIREDDEERARVRKPAPPYGVREASQRLAMLAGRLFEAAKAVADDIGGSDTLEEAMAGIPEAIDALNHFLEKDKP